MWYLIQHLASIKHIMIPWCVYSYCEVGKGKGFCRSTSALICDNSGIGTCVPSFLCLHISYHRYMQVNQQADYTVTPSSHVSSDCPACRTTLVATRFRVAVICPIIQVPHCIRVFFYFVWFVFINHIFQFYYELCTYCNILDIYLS